MTALLPWRIAAGRRHDLHHEGGRRLPGPERARNLVLDRLEALQIGGDGREVVAGHGREGAPRHDRRQDAAVWPHTGLQRGDDLGARPGAKPGFLVGREVWAMEDAKIRDLESDLGAAEIARHVRFAEEIARRVTVVATAKVKIGRASCRES